MGNQQTQQPKESTQDAQEDVKPPDRKRSSIFRRSQSHYRPCLERLFQVQLAIILLLLVYAYGLYN